MAILINSDSARIHSPDPFLRAESEERTPPNGEKRISRSFAESVSPDYCFRKTESIFLTAHLGVSEPFGSSVLWKKVRANDMISAQVETFS
jgi:hypothetical protein